MVLAQMRYNSCRLSCFRNQGAFSEGGTLCGNAKARFSGRQDRAKQFRVTHACKTGHQVQFAIPAPARIWVNLQQFDRAGAICPEIETRVVPAAKTLEKAHRIINELGLALIRQRGLAIADLAPVRTVRVPFRFVAKNLRQAVFKAGIMALF